MNEYCITFNKLVDGQEDPVEVFHTHVIAVHDIAALEGAFHRALNDNVCLIGADIVEIRLMLEIPPGLLESFDGLRSATHQTTPAAPQAAGHTLH